MAVVLTEGAAQLIHDGGLTGSATLQCIGVKAVKEKIYRARLSDSAKMVSVLMKGNAGLKASEDLLAEGAIITVKKEDFLKAEVSGKKLLLLQDLEVLEREHEKIGGPVEIKAEDTGATPTGATAMEVDSKPSLASPTPKGPANSSPTNTPPKAAAASPAATPLEVSKGGERIVPISQVNPYVRSTIKGQVVSKDEMRTFTGRNGMAKKVFSLTLMDDTCDIKATFWDEVADRYFDVLETGKSYTFHKGSFKMANQRYNSTKCEYEVTFNNDSIVEICRDVDAPQVRFSFVAIDKLQTMIGKNVDVVGVVTEVQELGEITIKQGRDAGKQKAKRNVSIADNSGMQISLTLWDSNAEAIDASAASDKAVLAVRAVRVSDYGGCSINTTRGSIMQLNPELPEAAALREWYDSKGGAPALTSVGGGAGAGAGGAGPAPRKYMSDIESEALGMKEKPDYFSVRATLMYVNHEKTWQYPSNPENKRKVTEEGGAWRDEKTGQIIDKCERRYIVPVSFTDLTGRHFLTVFDDDAKKIFGQTADDLFELQQQDEAAFQQVFKDAFFKEYVLKVRAKAETYQDQTRVKCSVVAADHVNFRSEGKLLLDTIRKYGL